MIPQTAALFCTIIDRAILVVALASGAAVALLGVLLALIMWDVNKRRDTAEIPDETEIVEYDEAA